MSNEFTEARFLDRLNVIDVFRAAVENAIVFRS